MAQRTEAIYQGRTIGIESIYAWFDKITWLPEEPAVLLQD